jgi:UDPglucose 6-dehydrogenase/GDP-mannose 6-dehydrogenase
MRIAVVGCGYVGLVSALGLASVGHEVVGIEVDPDRVDVIRSGKPPFHEPGVQSLLLAELESSRFRISSDLESVAECEVVFLAVQTPPDADGAIDLRPLKAASSALRNSLAAAPPQRRVLALRSTVVPGTVEQVVAPLFDGNVATASNPEFLREGSALDDFLRPDRVVIGCHEAWGRELLERVYAPFRAPLVYTSPATAELSKYASNALLATLVSFSNEISHICESMRGVDVEDVLGVIHLDRRFRTSDDPNGDPKILSYLKAGCGFGGSCLPKDISALIASAEARGNELPLLRAVRQINDSQPRRVVDSLEQALLTLDGRTIAVLGVAFKAGTDDLRSSAGIRMVGDMIERGAEVAIYDPLVSARAIGEYARDGRVRVTRTLSEAVAGADACVITTNAPEFTELPKLLLQTGEADDLLVVDGRRLLNHDDVGEERYIGVGRAPLVELLGRAQ